MGQAHGVEEGPETVVEQVNRVEQGRAGGQWSWIQGGASRSDGQGKVGRAEDNHG